jgi:HD-GYP domain-containing protein (c-di-GMP phosphodiesterase class II)
MDRPRRTDHLWLVPASGGDGAARALDAAAALRVGRCPTSDVVLPHPSVSRQHAVIEPANADGAPRWRIVDRGSSGGTWVNDERVPEGGARTIGAGDRVRFGPVAFRVARDPAAEAVTLAGRVDPVDPIRAAAPAPLAERHLDAAVEAGAAIHAAVDAAGVARAAVDAIAAASGCAEVAFVRMAADGAVEALASRGMTDVRARVPRRVLSRAATGAVTVIDDAGSTDAGLTLVRRSIARAACVPVALGDRSFGFLWMADPAGGTRMEPVAALARAIGATAALAFANLERMDRHAALESEHRAMFDGTMQALIASIDAKDPYTRGHSARVAEFAQLVAARAGLAPDECAVARLCGLVHDIGKIGVSEDVLRKPGRLTDEEFRHVAAHPVTGHEILRGIPQMSVVLPGVLHHHERHDGRGYPHGLAGEAIPLLARVVAVADAIDAMTTSRTYRPARPMRDAVAEVLRSAGTHFDPVLARVVGAIDLRDLQAIVGLHVFGPGSVSFADGHPSMRRTA